MFRKKKVNKLCLETLECRLAPAVSLMGDINTTPENSIPNNFEVIGKTLYFAANDGLNGMELWKSDGTANGTVLVKDIYPGSQGSMQQQPEKNQSALHRLIKKASRGVIVNNRLFREWKNSFFCRFNEVIRKLLTQTKQTKFQERRKNLRLEMLESRVNPAIATLIGGTLTLDYTFNGTTPENVQMMVLPSTSMDDFLAFSGDISGNKTFLQKDVTKIDLIASGASTDQNFIFKPNGTMYSSVFLKNGFSSTGVDTISIKQTIDTSFGSGAINIIAEKTVSITGKLLSGGGGINIQGQGIVSGNAAGVSVTNGGIASTIGTGSISISGLGGSGENGGNYGVLISGIGSKVYSENGSLSVKGQGGKSIAGVNNYGVFVCNGSEISTLNGLLAVSGNGGYAPGGFNFGVMVDAGASISSEGKGTIQIYGKGSIGDFGVANRGVLVGTGSGIKSVGTGGITIEGQGGVSARGENVGVTVAEGAITSSFGSVTLSGKGGQSLNGIGNIGIEVALEGKIQSKNSAVISLKGLGGSSPEGSNIGVLVGRSGIITSEKDGTISIEGNGGSSERSSNIGVSVVDSDSSVSSSNGLIKIIGTAGISKTGGACHGVLVSNLGLISSKNLANIEVTGFGNAGPVGFNVGVAVEQNGLVSSEGIGKITVYGKGGVSGAGVANRGVFVNSGGGITSRGTGSIGIKGEGGQSDRGENAGITVAEEKSRIESSVGGISLDGRGGQSPNGVGNIGIEVSLSGKVQSTNSPAVSFKGLGGSSPEGYNSGVLMGRGGIITSEKDGTISIEGTGGSSERGSNLGVLITDSGSSVNSSNGLVKITGYGNASPVGFSFGVAVEQNALVSSEGKGNITVYGKGGVSGAGVANRGVFVNSGGGITSRGTGSIDIKGDGGQSGRGENVGITVAGENSRIESLAGGISLDGRGGQSPNGVGNIGIEVSLSGKVQSTNSAAVSLKGLGGSSPEGYNSGVLVGRSGIITSEKDGTISIEGTGGSSERGSNLGVLITDNGSSVNSSNGLIKITGNAGTSKTSNSWGSHGVAVTNSGQVVSVKSANVEIKGFGKNGFPNFNVGVQLDTGGLISSRGSGNLFVYGKGGIAGDGIGNRGMFVGSGSKIISGGSGNVDIRGEAGNSSKSGNDGILIEGKNTEIVSSAGNINISGLGGIGVDGFNMGVNISQNATIKSSSGKISIDGVGGNGSGGNNIGVYIGDPNTSVHAVGDIWIKGKGGLSQVGGNNPGVLINNYAQVYADGPNMINVFGQGGAGLGGWNSGISVSNGSLVQVNQGVIDFKGIGGGELEANTAGVAIESSISDASIVRAKLGHISIDAKKGPGLRSLGFAVLSNGKIESGGGVHLSATSDQVWVQGGEIAFNDPVIDVPGIGKPITLINNQGDLPVVGFFRNLPEGGKFKIGQTPCTITYKGGTGNDVVISAYREVPVPSGNVVAKPFDLAAGSIVASLGDGRIGIWSADKSYQAIYPFPGYFGPLNVNTLNRAGGRNADTIVAAVAGKSSPHVLMIDANTGKVASSIYAFAPTFYGGVTVAGGITKLGGSLTTVLLCGAGSGSEPAVSVFDAVTGKSFGAFYAFSRQYMGGVRLAMSEVNGNGQSYAVVGSTINSHVVVFDLNNYLYAVRSFYTFTNNEVPNGIYLSAGDLDGDGNSEIIVGAGTGTASPKVSIFGNDGRLLKVFPAYGKEFSGGVRVAVSDSNQDGKLEIVVASGVGAPGTINIFSYDNLAMIDSMFISNSLSGAYVASNFSRL